MIRSLLLAVAVASSLSPGEFAVAQTVATDPVGFTSKTCLANSDTRVALSFTRPPEFTGAVESASGNIITVGGSPWAADQFVYASSNQPKTYFVLIGPHASSNPNEGRSYLVTDNGTNSLTVDLEGDSIAGVQPGTQIQVIPYFTLGTAFPASDANTSFIPSPTTTDRRTQILIPNYGGQGINLSTSSTYYFFNGAWRRFGNSPTENRNDDVLPHSGYFIVRNTNAETMLKVAGSVLMKDETTPLFTRTAGRQDNFVSVTRPVDVALNDLGLITSGAFAASSSAASRTDELLVFNNAAPGINKSASATYYYLNNGWRKFGQNPATDFGTDVIPAGNGFVIRKATGTGATAFWQNSPTYNP